MKLVAVWLLWSSASWAQGLVEIEKSPEEINTVLEYRQYSESEIILLQELEKRRVELERRERALELRERLIDLAELRLEEKANNMEKLQERLQALLRNLSEKEESELKSLTKIYEAMKPAAAANVLNRMDNSIVFDIFRRMNRKKTAKIMEKMDTTKSRLISEMLAEKSSLPRF